MQPVDSEPLDEDFAWYETHRAELSRKYEGRYIAIVDRKVIDHDGDFASLAERVFHRVGMRPVLMLRVTRAERMLRLRSPRRSRG